MSLSVLRSPRNRLCVTVVASYINTRSMARQSSALSNERKKHLFTMVANFKVYKKCSPNGKLAVYLGKRDFIDYLSGTEPVDGVVLINPDYVDSGRKVWCQLLCSFRYGREEDEVMGLNFQKDLYLSSEQIFPQIKKPDFNPTKLQDRSGRIS